MFLETICKITPTNTILVMICGLVVIGFTLERFQITRLYIPMQAFIGFTKSNESFPNKYVSVCRGVFNSRGAGNMLFVLTALLYVSKHTGRQPVMPQSFPHGWINHVFANDIPRLPNDFIYNSNTSRVVYEKGGFNFDPFFKNIHLNKSLENATTILICGYFHSFKYADDVEKELRDFLKYKNNTVKEVDDFIKNHTNNVKNTSYVGIHVRRGDFTWGKHLSSGFAVVDENYINASMNHIVASFDPSRTLVAFVCSDDIKWVKDVIEKLNLTLIHENLKVVYSIGHDAAFDLCLLSKCNASIISTGTYSWWSAWLANTPAVYYSLYPAPKSSLAVNFVRNDYYPSKWIGFP